LAIRCVRVPVDAANFSALLNLPARPPLRALILGVTPELYSLDWPSGSTVCAVDQSSEMIGAIWPGPSEHAFNANWLDLPFEDETFDCVVCDGGLHLLSYPNGQMQLSDSIARVLKPGGQLVFRLFSLPEVPETPTTVMAAVRAGEIPNTNVFKLRLGMSLQEDSSAGVILGDVFDSVIAEFGDLDGLHTVAGWPWDEVQALLSYRVSTNCYHFINDAVSAKVLTTNPQISQVKRVESNYALGERCPLYLFRKEDAQ